MRSATDKPKRQRLVAGGKRPRCPKCNGTDLRVCGTPRNDDKLLIQRMKCRNPACGVPFTLIRD
jgi:hypothetical protein